LEVFLPWHLHNQSAHRNISVSLIKLIVQHADKYSHNTISINKDVVPRETEIYVTRNKICCTDTLWPSW
jgi:hypothetical protein